MDRAVFPFFTFEHSPHISAAVRKAGNQCTMWLSFSKNGIRDSNQISTTAPIFLQFNYFRQNLEENVTFTFYFFSFASNFPCKILWDNKNIDANILIFQIPFSQCCWPRRKKLFWGFFLSIKKICLCAKFEVSPTPATGFLPITA